MSTVKNGDKVKVHYTGKLEDGKIFDSSKERHPLEFVAGEGKVIAGFDEAVLGMNVGESKTVNIPCDKAYGDYRKELLLEVDRKQLPPDINPKIGEQLEMTGPEGQRVYVKVTHVNEDVIVMDANPPLAGENLIFDIELVEIV